MKEKIMRSGLLVVVICSLAFLASYSAFFAYKEKGCAKSLYSAQCYITFTGFLEKYL